MQVSGKHFLACARFAGDQHRGPRTGNLTRQLQHTGNGRVLAHNARARSLLTGLVAAESGNGRYWSCFAFLTGYGGNTLHVEGLKPVIARAKTQESFGFFGAALVGNDDNWGKIGIFRTYG